MALVGVHRYRSASGLTQGARGRDGHGIQGCVSSLGLMSSGTSVPSRSPLLVAALPASIVPDEASCDL